MIFWPHTEYKTVYLNLPIQFYYLLTLRKAAQYFFFFFSKGIPYFCWLICSIVDLLSLPSFGSQLYPTAYSGSAFIGFQSLGFTVTNYWWKPAKQLQYSSWRDPLHWSVIAYLHKLSTCTLKTRCTHTHNFSFLLLSACSATHPGHTLQHFVTYLCSNTG